MLEHKGLKVLMGLELRWSLGFVLKEPLISDIQTLNNLLDALRVEVCALDALGEVLLHCVARDVLAVNGIVPLLQRQCVIPYKTSLSLHIGEVSGAFRPV